MPESKVKATPEPATESLTVGEGIAVRNAGWTFGGDVAKGFSSHVSRSVPLYHEGHDLICKISDFFIGDGSVCYEIGSSTGVLTSKLAQRHSQTSARFIGLDVEEPMVEQARVESPKDLPNLSYEHADGLTFPMEPADLIIAYYTVQFVPPPVRQQLIDKIYNTLKWGGAFILFEKVRAADARFQDYMTGIYTDFKVDQGYSGHEIVSKARSLKRVLEPFSTQGNIDLMSRAGFKDIMTVQKWVCFEGFLAIK